MNDSILNTKAEKNAETAESLSAFSGLKLLHIKKKVSLILARIGQDGIFDEYTKHDISHIDSMLSFLDWLIPNETKEIMTQSDWLMIVLSIYFHDLGMLVTKEEYNNRSSNPGYNSFKENILNDEYGIEYKEKIISLDKDRQDRFIYQEFVRKNHAARIHCWIENDSKNLYYKDLAIVEEIKKLLSPLDPMFRRDLAIICESHHLNDLDNFEKYKTKQEYGQTDQESVNLHYAALILRTADLLHITSDRTPSIEFVLINPSDPISQEEWRKQKSVKSVKPKDKRNEEGIIDPNAKKDTIAVTAYFEEPDGFFALISYINYAKEQIVDSLEQNQIASKKHGNRYGFPWKTIDDSLIEAKNFEKRQFEFVLDQNRILDLLVGHTLYNDSTVVLRELSQNCIDAVKLQEVINREEGGKDYKAEINIEYNKAKNELSFYDNGTGMSLDVIEKHLLKAGSSRYQDPSFIKRYPEFSPISRFGIGLLTCFLIANDIDIITKTNDLEEAIKLCIRKVHGKYLLKYIPVGDIDPRIQKNGTCIKLYIRRDVELDNLENDLNKWILFPPCDFFLIDSNKNTQVRIGETSPKAYLEKYLLNNGYILNETNHIVKERYKDGVSMAYVLRYDEFLNEWGFLSYNSEKENNNKNNLPLGICIEGIRVDFDTPGFEGKPIIAIANAKGKSAPRTNVARSNIENTIEKDNLLTNIYELYFLHFTEEYLKISSEQSISWAITQISYQIDSFLNSPYNRHSESLVLKDDLLRKEISKIKCILLEEEEERIAVSINQLVELGSFWSTDCNLFSSANSLLREIPALSKTSTLSLVNTLCTDIDAQTVHIDRLLCNFKNNSKVIQEIIRSTFEISEIKIIPSQRRVDLYWDSKKQEIWKSFSIYDTYRRRPTSICYLQIGDIQIDNIENNIAINTDQGFFLLRGSKLSEYVEKIYNQLVLKKEKYVHEDFYIFSEIVSFLTDFFYTKNKELDYIEEIIEKRFDKENLRSIRIWDKIDKDELIETIVCTNFTKYDSSRWYRRWNYDYEY